MTSFTRKSRKYSSYKGNVERIAPNRMNHRINTFIPHQKITTNTTEFKYYEVDDKGRMAIKMLYLDSLLDIFNSEILSHSIDKQLSAQNIMNALNKTINITSDYLYIRTFRSDRDWAYQLKAYNNTLKSNCIYQSISRKGNCYEELKDSIENYIDYYNDKRIKLKLSWMSPVEYNLNQVASSRRE